MDDNQLASPDKLSKIIDENAKSKKKGTTMKKVINDLYKECESISDQNA